MQPRLEKLFATVASWWSLLKYPSTLNLGVLRSQHGHVSARLLSLGIKLDFFYCRAFETNEKHWCLYGAQGGLLNDLLWVYSVHKMNQLCKVIQLQTAKPCPTHNTRVAHLLSYTINIHLQVCHYSCVYCTCTLLSVFYDL